MGADNNEGVGEEGDNLCLLLVWEFAFVSNVGVTNSRDGFTGEGGASPSS